MRIALLLGLSFALVSISVHSQTPPALPPQLEAVSIHMAAPFTEEEVRSGAANNPWSIFPTNRFTATRLTLKLMIGLAYGVDQPYLQGDPEWLDVQHYSIEAKVEGDKALTYDEIKPLLQHMLEERFHLATHHVTKLTSGYALVVAKGGAKLETSKVDDKNLGHAYILTDRIDAQQMSMGGLASMLARPVGAPVVDMTKLKGTYDFELSYAPENDPGSSRPFLFTALQEQLGLKLESQKVPIDFLVIDHVDRIPTDN